MNEIQNTKSHMRSGLSSMILIKIIEFIELLEYKKDGLRLPLS